MFKKAKKTTKNVLVFLIVLAITTLVINVAFAADKPIASNYSSDGDSDRKGGLWGPYWSSPDKGVIIFVNNSAELSRAYTSDGGDNWTVTAITTTTTVVKVAAWYDKENVDNTGTLVHITWLDDATDDCFYRTLDVSDNSLGTRKTVDDGLNVHNSGYANELSITQTVSGNIIVGISTQVNILTYKSADNFVTAGTSISSIYEAGNQEDKVLLFPATTGDDNDAVAIFGDRNVSELSIKMYDDSVGNWIETSISGSMTQEQNWVVHGGAVRHSDGHILLVSHSNLDDAGDDLRTWDITPDDINNPDVTAKTNIFTDQSEAGGQAMIIDQQTDDVYVAYIKGGTWGSSSDVVFHKSDDGMATWGTEQKYSETTDDVKRVHGGRTIGDSGGRIQWGWVNDDYAVVYVNLVNDIEIAEATEPAATLVNKATINSGGVIRINSGGVFNQ